MNAGLVKSSYCLKISISTKLGSLHYWEPTIAEHNVQNISTVYCHKEFIRNEMLGLSCLETARGGITERSTRTSFKATKRDERNTDGRCTTKYRSLCGVIHSQCNRSDDKSVATDKLLIRYCRLHLTHLILRQDT